MNRYPFLLQWILKLICIKITAIKWAVVTIGTQSLVFGKSVISVCMYECVRGRAYSRPRKKPQEMDKT